MHSKLLLFSILALAAFSFNLSFAQHHGGTQAPPVSFGDKKVALGVELSPPDFVPSAGGTANVKVRFFDSITNTNIEHVTYRVQIYSGDKLLANQIFFDKDGELNFKVKPVSGCQEKDLWRCTTYEGEKDLIVPNALTSSGNDPPIIKGPVFDKSGTYDLKISILGATNPKTQTVQDIDFETSVSIAQEQQLSLSTSQGKTPVTVRAFQDELTNFRFDEATKSISFSMPFHWEHAEHVSLVRNDIEIPKTFAPYQNVNSFKGTVNGMPVFPSSLHYDPHSSSETNTLHFLVSGEELKMLARKAGAAHTMDVVITPDSSSAIKSADIKFSNGYKATVSYDTRYGASKDVAFTMAFFDSSGMLAKDVRYAYSVKDESGNEFTVNTGNNQNLIGIAVPSGVDSRLINIPSEGSYVLQVVLTGRGLIDFDSFVLGTMKFDVRGTKAEPTSQIPSWIRNNAKWWADGTIGDKDFVSGVQFLIKQGILKIPPTTPEGPASDGIPAWVKNNAKWWADGTITDDDFVKGIQFLVSRGIIRV